MRLLFLILAIWLGITIIRYFLRQNRTRDLGGSARPNPVQQMVRCEVCGVHLPKRDAVQENGRYFCCDEHRRQHDKAS